MSCMFFLISEQSKMIQYQPKIPYLTIMKEMEPKDEMDGTK